MARITVSTLNIVVHPHSSRIYRELIEALAELKDPVSYFGSRVAKIGEVRLSMVDWSGSNAPPGSWLIGGYANTFELIDKDEPWYDEQTNTEAENVEEVRSALPSHLHPSL